MSSKDIVLFLKTLKPQLEKDGIVSLGLFGSFARGEEDNDSDIDILIETTEKFMQKYKSWDAFVYIDENIREVIEKKFHKKVDIFDKNSNSAIKSEIMKETCYV
jgi:predicted nucleotidyltransferase